MAALWLVPVLGAAAPVKRAAVETPWSVAEAAHAQLEEIPAGQRTVADYRTVMDAYRLIYHADPGDLHAPESIYAVGNLLAEQGIVLRDARPLQMSLGQYEFLRKQYPTSSLRMAALLEEAHVAVAGLHDLKLAREKYAEFVESYPKSARVPEARSALLALKSGRMPVIASGPLMNVPAAPESAVATDAAKADAVPAERGSLAVAVAQRRSSSASSNGVPAAAVAPGERAEASLLASERKAPATGDAGRGPAVSGAGVSAVGEEVVDAAAASKPRKSGGMALVTGIRHWSTPTYTRVAIDLGDEVQYQAARVPHPDRIYFDLHGTRLAQELVGKAFDVVDDGFLKRVRAAQYTNDSTRIVLDVNDVTEYSAFLLPNPYRLIIDIHGGDTHSGVKGTDAARASMEPVATTPLPQTLAVAEVPSTIPVRSSGGAVRDVAALSQQPDRVEATAGPTSQPIAVVAEPLPGQESAVDATPRKAKRGSRDAVAKDVAADVSAGRTAAPTAEGQRSLMRALGLKIGRIVIDPGHGGHDAGTIGAGGIMEKDVVLDVALRLGKLLHDHLGAEIIYTRSDDTFIPLETRTAIANKAEADLFISVHANSSPDASARGVETYYLNFTSQPDALDVAARENAVSDQSVHELSTMVKKITLKEKIDESREFAQDVEQTLYDGLQRGNAGLKNRGVKKAPFVVLIGANMPSVLTEISFVTNPQDAAELRTGDYRERVAESIYRGVARYAQGLGGMRVAAVPAKVKGTP